MDLLPSRELTVENTTHCNAACLMCPRESFGRKFAHMDFGLFQEVIRQGVELGITSLDLCGFGDPFMDPGFEDKLEWVKVNYPMIKTYTSSTGDLMVEKRLERASKYLDTIKFSHYGASAESYAAIHKGSVNFERAKSNILRMLDLPRDRRPYVIVNYLILPENESETQIWRNFWETRADEISIWKPHNFGGGRDYGHLQQAAFKGQTAKSCGRPFNGNPYVRTNGEVSMCCFDYDHRLLIGDLRQQTLREILTGQMIARIRDVHHSGNFKDCGLICETCDQIYDRQHALVYSSNNNRRVGITTTHPDLINDMLKI